uniref:PAS domain-containing protein n=1 Tax=Methanosarcina horonobensis TaxID=418008 RepID=UPI002FCE1686
MQNFHGIVFQFDENFAPVFLDGAVEGITGYREKDLTSRDGWREIIYPADLTLVLKEEEKVQNFSSSGYVNIEYRIKHLDGSIRWINEILQKNLSSKRKACTLSEYALRYNREKRDRKVSCKH